MAITKVSSTSNYGQDTAPTVTIPATEVLADDLIIVYLTVGDDVAPSATPTGFTQVCDPIDNSSGDDYWNCAYYMVAVGGEESDTVDWTLGSTEYWTAGVLVLRGVHADIWDATRNHTNHHLIIVNDSSPTCATLDTATADAVVIEITACTGANLTSVSSDDGAAVEWINQANPECHCLATYKEEGTPGTHGGATHTYVGTDVNPESAALVFALKPAAGAQAYTLPATGGSFSIVGTAVGLLKGFLVGASAASFAVTGTDATLSKGRILEAESGSVAVTGTAAGFDLTRHLGAGSGTFAVTGTAASLERGLHLGAGGGTYAITGTSAGFVLGKSLIAGSGTHTITGTAADLFYGRHIGIGGGTFAITGTSASLLQGYHLGAGGGTYAVTGTDATLTLTGATSITADSGAFSLTGTAAGLSWNRLVTAAGGTFTLTGTNASLAYGKTMTASLGTFTITGTAVTLTYTPGAGVTYEEGEVTFLDYALADMVLTDYQVT